MDIIGLVVSAFPDQREAISDRLLAIPGLEIHHVTSDGRLIVTIEQSTHQGLKSALNHLERVDHVLSTSVAYQYSDEVDDANVETSPNENLQGELHRGP